MGERRGTVCELLSTDLPVELEVVLLKEIRRRRGRKSRFCRFPYLSLKGRSSDAGVLFR